MDKFTKDLPIDEARRLINKFVDDSKIDDIENFWLTELSNTQLSDNDLMIYNRIIEFKGNNSEISQALYSNSISGKIIHTLIKKNWRRLFNTDIIEKYYNYTKQKQYEENKTSNCFNLLFNESNLGDRIER